jgi:tRNA(Ile)-lysidine synthase
MPTSPGASSRQLLARIRTTIRANRMLDAGDSVLVALSGGPDSVALLHVLLALVPEFGFRIGVAHLDHQLRSPRSQADAQFAAAMAKRLGLACFLDQADVMTQARQDRLSIEDAARRARHGFLNSVAQRESFEKIALGHHKDDNAETVLLQMIRGAGTAGLKAMPPVGPGRIIRPLIDVCRQQLMAFLTASRLSWVTDDSNADPRFLRNRVRHRLLPLLKAEFNPGIVDTLQRSARIVTEMEDWMALETDRVFADIAFRVGPQTTALTLPGLTRLPVALQRRVIRKSVAAVKGSLQRIGWDHVEAVCRLATRNSSRGAIHLPDRILVQRRADALVFSREAVSLRRLSTQKTSRPEVHRFIEAPGTRVETLAVPETQMRLRLCRLEASAIQDLASGPAIAFLDMDGLRFPLELRSLRPGDRFVPLGLDGSQKVRRFFIHHKIAPPVRDRALVLVSAGEIVWLVGHRIDHRFRVTGQTRNVLKIEVLLA